MTGRKKDARMNKQLRDKMELLEDAAAAKRHQETRPGCPVYRRIRGR